MDEHINFSAKYKSWVVVKKMKVGEEIEDIDVGRILLSIRDTLNDKIYDFIGQDFDTKALEAMADELVPTGRLKEDQIAAVLKGVRSPKTTKKLKELTDEKLKLEVYKQLYTEIVIKRLKLNMLAIKPLDKYLDDKNRRL